MVAGALRIAGNDPGLAHAASRAGIEALANRSAALFARLRGKGVKDISRILRRHYGELLLVEQIGRAAGSRANGLWLVLDADRDGEGLVPLRIVLRYAYGFGSLKVGEYALRLTAHTVARILQRSLHCAGIRAAGPMLLHHLAQASALIDGDALRHGDQVRTASPEGALLWEARRIDGKLILCGQTWIAADGADDARLRAACAAWATEVQPRA